MTTRIPQGSLRETCRAVSLATERGIEACIPLWPLHAERLAEGGCSPARVAEAARAALAALAAYDSPDAALPRLRVSLLVPPAGPVIAEVASRLSSLDVPGGPRIAFVSVEAPPALPLGAAKPADRSYWDDAMRAALPVQQAILVGPDGAVIDGGTASVWALLGDALVTPPAPPAIAGVARRYLLRNAARLGVRVEVGPLTVEDIELADEVLLTNAFGGAVPARGRGGPVSERAAGLFRELWRPDGERAGERASGGNGDPEAFDADEELTGSALVPATRLGRWSVRLATAMMVPLLLFYVFAAGGYTADGGLPDWLLLGPTALLGAGAAVLGVIALAREERALLVYLSASIGATVALSGGASILQR